jgi:7-cyano-7-deazaguanine reductase
MADNGIESLSILKRGQTSYPRSPEEAPLEHFANRYPHRDYVIEFHCPEFTSLCPITGQPDFAVIRITYVPDGSCLESKALKLYLFSFRNMGMFHEEITNKILDDIIAAIHPRWARVTGIMNARGGISITVHAEHCEPGFVPPATVSTNE